VVKKVFWRDAELLLLPRNKHVFTDLRNGHSQTATSAAPLSPTCSRSAGKTSFVINDSKQR